MSTGYQSNRRVGMLSKHMENFRFTENEAAEVGMHPEDTGVIVFIVLYLVDIEKRISRSKMEYYLLLLDRKCFDERGILLFSWDLNNGRIRNFKKFTEFMLKKGLILSNGSPFFTLQDTGRALLTEPPYA